MNFESTGRGARESSTPTNTHVELNMNATHQKSGVSRDQRRDTPEILYVVNRESGPETSQSTLSVLRPVFHHDNLDDSGDCFTAKPGNRLNYSFSKTTGGLTPDVRDRFLHKDFARYFGSESEVGYATYDSGLGSSDCSLEALTSEAPASKAYQLNTPTRSQRGADVPCARAGSNTDSRAASTKNGGFSHRIHQPISGVPDSCDDAKKSLSVARTGYRPHEDAHKSLTCAFNSNSSLFYVVKNPNYITPHDGTKTHAGRLALQQKYGAVKTQRHSSEKLRYKNYRKVYPNTKTRHLPQTAGFVKKHGPGLKNVYVRAPFKSLVANRADAGVNTQSSLDDEVTASVCDKSVYGRSVKKIRLCTASLESGQTPDSPLPSCFIEDSLDESLTNIQWLGNLTSNDITKRCVDPASSKHVVPTKEEIAKVNETYGLNIRPPYPYMLLIQMALLSRRDRMMTLKDICQWIAVVFPYYKYTLKYGWKNSIRHNLSLYNMFERVPITPKQHGSLWTIRPSCIPSRCRTSKAVTTTSPSSIVVTSVSSLESHSMSPVPICPMSNGVPMYPVFNKAVSLITYPHGATLPTRPSLKKGPTPILPRPCPLDAMTQMPSAQPTPYYLWQNATTAMTDSLSGFLDSSPCTAANSPVDILNSPVLPQDLSVSDDGELSATCSYIDGFLQESILYPTHSSTPKDPAKSNESTHTADNLSPCLFPRRFPLSPTCTRVPVGGAGTSVCCVESPRWLSLVYDIEPDSTQNSFNNIASHDDVATSVDSMSPTITPSKNLDAWNQFASSVLEMPTVGSRFGMGLNMGLSTDLSTGFVASPGGGDETAPVFSFDRAWYDGEAYERENPTLDECPTLYKHDDKMTRAFWSTTRSPRRVGYIYGQDWACVDSHACIDSHTGVDSRTSINNRAVFNNYMGVDNLLGVDNHSRLGNFLASIGDELDELPLDWNS